MNFESECPNKEATSFDHCWTFVRASSSNSAVENSENNYSSEIFAFSAYSLSILRLDGRNNQNYF